jgi:hypothetical protein
MQPQGPQLQDNPLPASYLDQIATPQKKPGMNNRLFLGIIGGAILLLLIVGGMILASAAAPKTSTNLTTLALRMETLADITKKADRNIQSGDLRAINTGINTYLLNAGRNIQEPLAKNKIKLGKAPKMLSAKEKQLTADLTAKLEDAKLNAVYDETYRSEMLYQLKTLSVLMNSIYKSTSSKSLKQFLQTSSKDLNALYKQLDSFDQADPNNQFGSGTSNPAG